MKDVHKFFKFILHKFQGCPYVVLHNSLISMKDVHIVLKIILHKFHGYPYINKDILFSFNDFRKQFNGCPIQIYGYMLILYGYAGL